MMNSNAFEREMKQILFFLIGFCFSLILFCPYLYADGCTDISSIHNNVDLNYPNAFSKEYLGTYLTWQACESAIYDASSSVCSGQSHSRYVGDLKYFYKVCNIYNPNTTEYDQYVWYADEGSYLACSSDSDSDGIPDGLDAYPDTDSAYQFRIMTNYFDSQGNCVGQLIVTSSGDYVLLGDLTAAEIEAGVSAGTYKSQFVNSQIWIDSSDLKEDGAKDIYSNGQSTKPVTSTKAAGLTGQASEGTKATTPTVQSAPTTGSQDGDSDSQSFKKIVDNSNSTNKNLENIAGYLGITNDYLAKLNNKTGSASSGGSVVTVNTPTADEIGQAIEDQLIDSGQTIDTTITANIPDLDETDTLTSIKTKYADRYDLFITTLKGSDLFSLPFGIFTGPSGSGSSIQTVNIGKWGSSSEQTATIDYSDYDNIWQILRSVLLLVTSFACFKILVLKKG